MSTNISKFWREVIEGYERVSRNHDLEITVARNNMEAKISYAPLHPDWSDPVLILIRETETAIAQTLVSP